MAYPNTFDEASAATEEMFANEQLSLEDVPPDAKEASPVAIDENQQNAENVPAEEVQAVQPEPKENQTILGQATQTAEAAAEVAAQKDGQLQQAMSEIEALRQQNQQLQGTIDEMSRQSAENIVDDVLSPPELDINGLAFADEETQKAEVAKFIESISDYNRKQIMDELSPAIEYAKKGMRDAEKAEAIEILSQIPELSGIKEFVPQLDRIIENNKWLSSDDMPMDEKYINAFAMAKGINSINNPPAPAKEPTTDELMELYNNNPAFQELVEKQRIEQVKQGQQVPLFSASSGAAGAALNIKEKPQTLDEASKRTREMFGGI